MSPRAVRGRPLTRWLAGTAGFGSVVLGAVLLGLGPAGAASVPPIPVTPPQSCATMATRFSLRPNAWFEIRFTNPPGVQQPLGTDTKSAYGNTVTLTKNADGTLDFVSQEPIEAVYVNKGTHPNDESVIYRYDPPRPSDTELGLLPVKLSGVDHVVLCWGLSRGGGDTTTTTVPATPPSIVPFSVPTTPTTEAVLPTSIVRPTVLPSSIVRTTTGALPETGGHSAPVAATGALALAGGLLLVTAVRRKTPDST